MFPFCLADLCLADRPSVQSVRQAADWTGASFPFCPMSTKPSIPFNCCDAPDARGRAGWQALEPALYSLARGAAVGGLGQGAHTGRVSRWAGGLTAGGPGRLKQQGPMGARSSPLISANRSGGSIDALDQGMGIDQSTKIDAPRTELEPGRMYLYTYELVEARQALRFQPWTR